MRRRWSTKVLTAVRVGIALMALTLLAARALPARPLRAALPYSTALSAQDGGLLRLTLATDGQYRLWVPLEAMPPRLPAAVLLYEDRFYYAHPGVNPWALIKAAAHLTSGGRRPGASTVTMQLARRLHQLDTRSVVGKMRQVACALWLEARYSKRDILEAYLNFAPYGRNIQGAGAASLIFFRQPLQRLAVPQVMALAVIPQNPRARQLDATAPQRRLSLEAARLRLWNRWLEGHPEDARFSGSLAAPIDAKGPEQLPFLAPHFTDALLRTARGDVHSTLDLARQNTVERIMHHFVQEQSPLGIRNAGALLIEVDATGNASVRAYVGSADYRSAEIEGQVNAVTAKRSPGSTLKPFVYALALDQGLLHPRTMLKDAPTSFGPFSPENFDGRFEGPIAAEDALIRSRNVPAVAVSSRLVHPTLYDFLQASGVARLNSERYYGLALTLGAGEVTMEELGRMYAMFLNGGRVTSLDTVTTTRATAGEPLISPEAAFITLDMLAKNPRPDTGQAAIPTVAWKTGTSWGYHDAWSVGVFGRYVLVVWIGNFDNTGNPAFVGARAAAPLLFRMIDALRAEGLAPEPRATAPPPHVAKIEVCAASGDLPNAACPLTLPTWYIPGKSPIRISSLHRLIYLDASGRRACGPGVGITTAVFEFWPSDLLQLFREAGMPRRIPPAEPLCREPTVGAGGNDAPQIVSPLRGVTYTLRTSQPQPLALRANSGATVRTLYWFADNDYLGRTAAGESLAWLPANAGHYQLRAIDDAGNADTRELAVETLP